MNAPPFTPGPWLCAVSDTHDGRLAIWADGGLAGATQVAVLPPEFRQVEANGRLIAKAPDLYGAVDVLLDLLSECELAGFQLAPEQLAKLRPIEALFKGLGGEA